MPASPQELIRPEILSLSAYHVPDASGMVKLDAMENPYRLPEPLRREVAEISAQAALNRYPDPSAAALKEVLRRTMGVPEFAGLLLGNGSDELIQLIALAVARTGATIVAPEPSFVMYRMIATFCGMRYVGVPLRKDFSLDAEALLAAVERERPAVVFVAYPNNPTGNLFPAAALEPVLERASGLVVIDEAYHAFAGASFMAELPRHANLLVMRTLSKLGLAGLRLGLLAGSPVWLQEFDKLRLPYNVGVLTQAVAARVLQHGQVLDGQARAIVEARARLFSSLSLLPGIEVFPSDANFILFRVPDAPSTFEKLRSLRVLIKNLHGTHPLLHNCLRVTVGTPDENAAFLDALRGSL
jgi:histidinol-phosphate aminotransferase